MPATRWVDPRLGAGWRWLLARAAWGLLGWQLRTGLRSALGGEGAPDNGRPTRPRRVARTRPFWTGHSPYPYPSAA